MKFGIVISQYYREVADGLLKGAVDALGEKDLGPDRIDVVNAPGAFEIPLIAMKLAQTGHYSGVICLGCVVRGETAHFDYICQAVSSGIEQAMLQTETPISFGVLTTFNLEQAKKRSEMGDHNKGREAALACWESAQTLLKITSL